MLHNFYYHVDTTHGSFNAMKSDAANEHKKGAPYAELSITPNQAATEALVKVTTTDAGYSPGWEAAPFVIRKFTRGDHGDAITMLNDPSWLPPGHIDT